MVAVSVIYGVFAVLRSQFDVNVAQPFRAASAVAGRPEGPRFERRPPIDPLARFGRSSLFIYWIHVELVYGYATWPIRARLPLWGVVVAYAAFCAVMYGAIVLRDRLVDGWRIRRVRQTAQTATV